MVAQADIYFDSAGKKYSNMVRFHFNKKVIDIPKGKSKPAIEDIKSKGFLEMFFLLNKQYGNCELEKIFPNIVWGDTLIRHRNNNKMIPVPDFSQSYYLKFSKIIPLIEVLTIIRRNQEIEFANEPILISLLDAPNDTYYQGNGKWAFDHIEAEKAWGVTKGKSDVVIGLTDIYNQNNNLFLPSDLSGKVDNFSTAEHYYAGHGISVAGIAGAMTNNNLDLASLAWNNHLALYTYGSDGIAAAMMNPYVNVINMSWIAWPSDTAEVRRLTGIAINAGIICVAGAGNDIAYQTPFVCYPAAYSFQNGQVIAVAGTKYVSPNEESMSGYFNYSPGTDPINDPENAFMDVSAPCDNLYMYDQYGSPVYSAGWGATSFATPWVSALAALIRSLNSNLTVLQVYDIITRNADKITPSGYPDQSYNSNGWSRGVGYGRINAYRSLRYTLENYGGTLTQSITIPAGDTWTIQPGVTISIPVGMSITIKGILNAQGTSAQPISFNRSGASGNWGSIIFDGSSAAGSVLRNAVISDFTNIQCLNGANVTIDGCILNENQQGIYIYNSSPVISNNFINDYYSDNNGVYGEASGLSPVIQGNKIKNFSSVKSGQGIYIINNTSLTFKSNDISGFDMGVYIGGGSTANTGSVSISRNNRVTDNQFGIQSAWGATVCTGRSNNTGSNNSIYQNTCFDVTCDNQANFTSYYDFFGSTLNYYNFSTGTLSINANISQNPWAGIPLKGINPVQPVDGIVKQLENITAVDDYFIKGYQLEQEGKIDESVSFYKDMISSGKFINFALTNLACIKNKYSNKNIIPYFDELAARNKELYPKVKNLMANFCLNENQFEKAISTFDEVINYAPEGYDGLNAKFGKLFAYLNVKKDKTTAHSILDDIKNMKSDDTESRIRIKIAEQLLGDNTIKTDKPLSVNDGMVVSKYDLMQNYPNPFNPATKIRYQVAKAGMVTIRVYDVLGRQVAQLVNETQNPGTYEAVFDGSKLTSGMYIYEIKVNGFTASKKMILLK